ncbi:RICIN domain-containing protein [Burkholderia oklahomensis]|uniref:Cytolethal distending toxin A/C family protein n=1 Tax=Burkholderia oklahomensis TaxID=342113 RepID=A0AAI8BC07_9BURK|nr:RICIN domain-containing protein [Burkholderia oklahomensis]AIO69482.1 cytolethal distending toxin A/C family protein [Burkholderia oklahomensis]AOI38868.1 lectin [Burkholderia oklahomensis EO147]KUY65572.1 lectin [Burkholderia oklahomensis EO147]QPS40785.1 RICIN domain-containing protein [Burkholderia oklahomensis]
MLFFRFAWRHAQCWLGILLAGALLPQGAAAAVTASYSDIVGADSGLCVSTAGNSTASGAGVVQTSCSGQSNTTWSFVPVGNRYHIVLQGSGLCLNVPGGSLASGTQLIQYACQDSSLTNDQWTIVAAGSSYRIVSASSGMCANVSGASRTGGAALIQYPCQGAGTLNDQFNLYLPVVTFTNVAAANSNLCVTVSGNSTAVAASIVQGTCSNQGGTSWSLLPAGSGYHVVSQGTGQCLNVSGASRTSGAPIIQYPCQGDTQTNDQWTIVPVGSKYRLVSVASGMCLNVSGGSLSPGAQLIQYPCQDANALNDQFSLSLPQSFPVTLPSAWSPVIPLPVNPIGIANTPNGKLVMWSADQQFSFQNDVGGKTTQTLTAVFDPATNQATQYVETSAGSDMFCPGTAMLPDGRLLVNGGDSSPKTTLYDWTSNTWSAAAAMNIPRGYQGDTLLSNGSVLTLGGSWSGGQGGKSAEVWTNGGAWTVLPGVPETNVVGPDPQGIYRGDNHLWLFAQGNGAVFHAGPSSQMNWISTAGGGSIQSAGTRGVDPFSINGTASLYDVGKILKAGGAKSYQQNGSITTYASNSVYQIDITRGPNQPVSVQRLNGMTYQRAFANSVILPNGSVVLIGGQSVPMPFTDTTAIMVPEIWDPTTQRFNLLKPMQTPRTYHSTAILMPDGRVFAGGGGQCGAGCAMNHLNAEILTPPYLLNADGAPAQRPVIVSAPASAARGASIGVSTQGPVTSFVLMRLASVTHTTNNDQRRIPLAMTSSGGTDYRLAIPADAGVVLPGYYMLFALNAQGVPSVSTSIRIS